MGHSPVVPPRSLSPYGVLAHDPVALVRYKVGQRAVKGNPLAMGARRRLRDEFAVLDPTLSSQCTRQEFLGVLRLYNIDMKDQDWGAFAQKQAGNIVASNGMINYKKFLSDGERDRLPARSPRRAAPLTPTALRPSPGPERGPLRGPQGDAARDAAHPGGPPDRARAADADGPAGPRAAHGRRAEREGLKL